MLPALTVVEYWHFCLAIFAESPCLTGALRCFLSCLPVLCPGTNRAKCNTAAVPICRWSEYHSPPLPFCILAMYEPNILGVPHVLEKLISRNLSGKFQAHDGAVRCQSMCMHGSQAITRNSRFLEIVPKIPFQLSSVVPMGWQALDKEGFVAKSGVKRFETTVHHVHFQLVVIELMERVVIKFMAIVDQGVEIWKVSWWYCIIASLIFSSLVARMGTSVMLLKGRFLLRSSFSIFQESVLKCWTSGAVRLRSRKSLRACTSVFNVCWNWGSRSPNSIPFAARDSRNCCQTGSSLLDRLGDGSAALACRAFITISNSSFVRVRSGLCSSLVGAASSMAANGLSSKCILNRIEKCWDIGTILDWGSPKGPQHVPRNGKWWIWKNWPCAIGQSTTSPPSFCSSGLCQMPAAYAELTRIYDTKPVKKKWQQIHTPIKTWSYPNHALTHLKYAPNRL